MGASTGGPYQGPARSVEPCPVCGQHTLALEQPPHIPVSGAQPYTELYRMGDLSMPVGVRCRSCGTAWPTMAAFEAGEPGSAEDIEPVEGLDESEATRTTAAGDSSPGPVVAAMVAVGVGVALAVAGLLELAFVVVGAALLGIRALAGRRGRP